MESKCCGYCTARFESRMGAAKYCSRTCQVKARTGYLKKYKSKKRIHLIQTDKMFFCQGYNTGKSKKTDDISEVTCKCCLGRYEMSLKCTVYTNEEMRA